MAYLHLTMLTAAAFALTQPAVAFDLEVSIRTHSQQVVFGDPIYIEVTITNRANEVISASRPSTMIGTFGFTAFDSKRQISMPVTLGGGGMVGGMKPVQYAPGESVKHYWSVFLPNLPWLDHPFWTPIGDGQSLDLTGVYHLDYVPPGLSLRSNSVELFVKARDEEDMRTLQHWTHVRQKRGEKGPLANDWGIGFRSGLNRQQTGDVASKVTSGELADLLKLTIRFQDLYAGTGGTREAGTSALVEWLKMQPDIKREVLIKQSLSIAKNYRMPSTRRAIETPIEELK